MVWDQLRSLSITRYWAISFVVLLIASLGLWLPPDWPTTKAYPAVPMSAFMAPVVQPFGYLAIPILGTLCVAIIVLDSDSPRDRKIRGIGWFLVSMVLVVGFAVDQHRLQPWAYQTFLYGLIWTIIPRQYSMPFLRVITASIYLYSSAGKFDFQFVHTVGQEFLITAGRFVGWDVSAWDEVLRNRLVLIFPAVECSVAIACVAPPTRRLGGVLAIAMHGSLLLLLSPWGMNHSFGVLTWNAVLAGQAYLLFVRPVETPSTAARPAGRLALASILTFVVVVLPLSERRGRGDTQAWHWDHWLSWSLYSPHSSRFYLEVHQSRVADIHPDLRSAVDDDPDGDGWHAIDLGEWSLSVRGVPILPQARYQLLLAIATAEQHDWRDAVRGVVRSASDRHDGTRREEWLIGRKDMKKAASRYWLQ